MTAIFCEGRSSDLPFLRSVFEVLLACQRLPDSAVFPLAADKSWTKLQTPGGRTIGIKAAGSYEKVLAALPAAGIRARELGISIGVVVDLDTKSLSDRESAVTAALRSASPIGLPQTTVVGIGLSAVSVPIALEKNLDQLVCEILLKAQPSLIPILQAAVSAVSSAGQSVNWKFATCVLAGALGREDSPEAIYHYAVRGFTAAAQSVLATAGLLAALEPLVRP